MSFAILRVHRPADRYGHRSVRNTRTAAWKLIVFTEPERFALEIVEIGDVERPPMNTIPIWEPPMSDPEAMTRENIRAKLVDGGESDHPPPTSCYRSSATTRTPRTSALWSVTRSLIAYGDNSHIQN